MVESAFTFGGRRGDLKGSDGILSTDRSGGLHITLSIWRMVSSLSELNLAAPPIEDLRLSWNNFFASHQLVKDSENFSHQIREYYDHGIRGDYQLVLVDGPMVVRLTGLRKNLASST